MSRRIDRDKSTFKLVAVVVSAAAILASAFAIATTGSFAGLIAYGAQDQNQTNTTSNDTSASARDSETSTASETLVASASDCTPVMTAEETVTTRTAASVGEMTNSSSGISATTTANASSSDKMNTTSSTNSSMSSGMNNNTTSTAATSDLNATQTAMLQELIEKACDAIRHDKSVTALGFLATAQDILNQAETATATAGVTDDVEDENESANSNDDMEDQSENDITQTGTSSNTNGGY